MNPLTNMRNLAKINEKELATGVAGKDSSWHQKYKDSAWIFVGGLPYALTEGDVICAFSQFGEIVNINLIRDQKTGKSKGFAFLCYEDQRSTILAVDNLNGSKLAGRSIRVDHVEQYKVPKLKDDMDPERRKILEEGCAPTPTVVGAEVGAGAGGGSEGDLSPKSEPSSESDDDRHRKKKKKEKKHRKKEKRDKEKKKPKTKRKIGEKRKKRKKRRPFAPRKNSRTFAENSDGAPTDPKVQQRWTRLEIRGSAPGRRSPVEHSRAKANGILQQRNGKTMVFVFEEKRGKYDRTGKNGPTRRTSKNLESKRRSLYRETFQKGTIIQ